MATPRALSNGKFRAEITKNYTFITSKTFLSESLAQKFIDDTHNNIEVILNLKPKQIKKLTPNKVDKLGGIALFRKLSVDVSFMLFKELADEYLRQWAGKDEVNQTIRVKYWIAMFGSQPIKAIKTKHINTAMDNLEVGIYTAKGVKLKKPVPRSSNTVLRYKGVLSSIFNYASGKKQCYLKKNPVDGVEVLGTPNKIIRFLSDVERKALLSACKKSSWDKMYLLVLMAITSGMRKSELMNLTFDKIDFNKGLATLDDTKNGLPRINALPEITMTELKKHRQIGGGLVFGGTKTVRGCTVPTGKPFEFRARWVDALKEAGITEFRFHDLRHTAASYLIMNGATLKEVAEILGHKSTVTTDRYAHLSTAHKSQLVERVMGDVFSL